MGNVFSEVYQKFKLHYYRDVFRCIRNRELSLSTVETLSVEIIAALKNPTINEFANYINISFPNATYKVNSLMQKGYVEKIQSDSDKREYKLRVTDKYYKYYNLSQKYLEVVENRIKDSFTPEEYENFTRMFEKISNELMPEEDIPGKEA